MAKRRTRWIDTVSTTPVALAGAAAPGTVIDESILPENELETLGTGATLIRVVGHIHLSSLLIDPVVTAALWFAPNYAGAVFPVDWLNDVFERQSVIWTGLWRPKATKHSNVTVIDIRAKRKVSPGQSLILSMQNHSPAGSDAEYVYHLRSLLLLP